MGCTRRASARFSPRSWSEHAAFRVHGRLLQRESRAWAGETLVLEAWTASPA